jgi:hypothetical protein
MGANTIRLRQWNETADHLDFLDQAYHGGDKPIYVIPDFQINPDLNIDPGSPDREKLISDFRRMVALHKNHPAILMWSIGNNLNQVYSGNLDHLFSLINDLALAGHEEEGSSYHPVITALADLDLIQTLAGYGGSALALDIWAANVYRGASFGDLFSSYAAAVTNKPLLIMEFGIDAFDQVNGMEYEAIGRPYQAEYAQALWGEIGNNAATCIGGVIRSYADEWWLGKDGSGGGCPDPDPVTHSACGYEQPNQPEGYTNDEWWGIMQAKKNAPGPDVMEPREAYYRLQSLWNPPAFSVLINGDAPYTQNRSVTLNLSCADMTKCVQIQVSNNGTTWSGAQNFTATRTWNLSSGDGSKTVYVRFRDTAGVWSGPVSDTIVLDTRAPSTIAAPAGGTYTSDQTITLTCGDGTGSGCHRTYYTLDESNPTTASNVYSGPLLVASTITLKYFSRDLAGNTEAVKTQSYKVDTTIPTGTIVINSGDDYTQKRGVTLTLSCSDNVPCYRMQLSNDNVTWSNLTAYSVIKNWTLTAGDGGKTVYVKYRDNVGNWSETYSDAITLDATPPVNGSLTATAGTAQVDLQWSGFTDALSGIAGYRLVFNTGSAPASCSVGTLIYSGTDTSYLHTNLTPGTKYYYRLCAQDQAGNSSAGFRVNATP